MSAAGDGDGDDYCDAAAELRQFQGSILPNFLLGSSFETESLSATLFGGYNAKNFSPLSCFFAASSLFAADFDAQMSIARYVASKTPTLSWLHANASSLFHCTTTLAATCYLTTSTSSTARLFCVGAREICQSSLYIGFFIEGLGAIYSCLRLATRRPSMWSRSGDDDLKKQSACVKERLCRVACALGASVVLPSGCVATHLLACVTSAFVGRIIAIIEKLSWKMLLSLKNTVASIYSRARYAFVLLPHYVLGTGTRYFTRQVDVEAPRMITLVDETVRRAHDDERVSWVEIDAVCGKE